MTDQPATGTALVAAPEHRHQIVRPAPVPSGSEIDRLMKIGHAFARSGAFKDVKDAETAFTKILLGRELGLSAPQSMQSLYIVEGSLMVAYPMLGNFIRSRDGYDYQITEHDETAATVVITIDGEERGTSRFTIEDAQTAGLIKDKSGWVKYPKNMLLARAMSNAVKWFVPEVTNGIPVYVEDEIEIATTKALLGAGEGDGSAGGIELPEGVEPVISRARALGYAPFTNRGVVEIAVGGRDDVYAKEWVAQAHTAMDEFMATRSAEAAADATATADPPPTPEEVADAQVVPTVDDLADRLEDQNYHAESASVRDGMAVDAVLEHAREQDETGVVDIIEQWQGEVGETL